MNRLVHEFDNGVKVYDDHLLPVQRDRYRSRNVHEADEEDVFLALLDSIPAEGCYVNIGSAIGYYPLLARKRLPGLDIHVVEPLERHREFFLENIVLNGEKTSRFRIHAEAISSENGRAEFMNRGYGSFVRKDSAVKEKRIPGFLRNRSYTPPEARRRREKSGPDRKLVRTMTLDALVGKVGKRIDLCQMDVQGLEADILKGAHHSLGRGIIGIFLIGTHSPELHAACSETLKRNGYVIDLDHYATVHQPDGILVASRRS